MSLQVDGKRVRMNTMVNDRRVAEDIFSAFKVEQAKAHWLGIPPSDGDHTLQELIEEYLTKITPRKSSDSQRRDHGMLSKFSCQWGTLRLDKVTAKAIEDYILKLVWLGIRHRDALSQELAEDYVTNDESARQIQQEETLVWDFFINKIKRLYVASPRY